jgi:endonuclease-3
VALPNAPVRAVRSVLKPAGLSNIKARQLRGAIAKIVKDFGRCDLRQMRTWPESEVEEYLIGLPGVSEKVAKCVMMYTLGCSVLPVDTHVHRIASRLGWTKRRRADQSQSELEELVPRDRRYAFHVDCIAHGRTVCRPTTPACSSCCIRRYCEFQKSRS